MATNTSDELQNLMAGISGDPSDPAVQKAKLNLLFARWGRPPVQPSDVPDTLDSTPGAGSDDGANNGWKGSAPVPGSSEQSAEPNTAATVNGSKPSLGKVQRAQAANAALTPTQAQPSPDTANDASLKTLAKTLVASGAPIPGASAQPGFAGADLENHVGLPVPPHADAEPGSTEDLENRAESSLPGMFAFAARPTRAQRAKNFLVDLLGRFGNAGYAISGGDPRAMRLKEQGEQFEEEMQREKADPEYQRRVAEATTPGELEVSRGPNGDYHYVNVDRFSGRATPTGISAPMPEKSPAQVLNEFVQNNPDALTPGTEANRQFHEIAEAMRAFPSNQAEIHANAEMYVGRLGVQRAIVQADGLIKAMQGRGITDMAKSQADALNEQLQQAAKGWADFYVQHPYLQAMGIGPDAEGQAQFMAGIIEQIKAIGLQANQTVQKIPGAAHVVPTNQVPIIGPAANAAGRGKNVAPEGHQVKLANGHTATKTGGKWIDDVTHQEVK